jgi:hypothetical protein
MHRGCAWLIRGVLDWMIGYIDTLYTTLGTADNYCAIADLHTLQFTVTHTLRFSVFTSRFLAMDLSQSHCHFRSHMESSFHRLISFLSLFCNCQFRRLDSIQFLCSQAHILVVWRPEIQLFTSDSVICCWTLLCNNFARTPQEIRPLLLRRSVYWSVA